MDLITDIQTHGVKSGRTGRMNWQIHNIAILKLRYC